jgi:hypothetical protein
MNAMSRLQRLLTGLAAATICACFALPALAQSIMLPQRNTPAISVQQTAKTGERTYVVQPGDTLWTISEGMYNEPWYWPSLWSYNPQITNPHLIYPGDTLYLSRRTAPMIKQKAITFAASRFERRRVTPTLLARRVGYISARDYRESGVIEASREERNMLGTLDEVYARFSLKRCSEVKANSLKNARKGDDANDEEEEDPSDFAGPCVRNSDRFVVYRIERPVVHPLTNKRIGFKINFLGEGEVINTRKKLVTMVLTKAVSEIARGDLITNVFEPLSIVKPKKNEVQHVATVIDFHQETVASGQFAYVYIDRGAEHGVKRGNRFEVVWRGDGLRGTSVKKIKDYPDEQIGIAMVVEAYDRHSLCVLTDAIREIERGMPAIMAKGF